jgi:myo-inositol-1(or 4)-monophosphatase
MNIMIKTARKVGRSLIKDFQEVENLQVSSKSAGDFVSKADIRAEEIIRHELTTARPTYGWLGEETGATEGDDPTRRWIVDPLDGTTNFLHGMPHFAVSIALEHKGQIVAGVVYDPSKDELFFAEKGGGAWMNESRIRVSDRIRMTDAVFSTGLPFAGRGDLPRALQELARLLPACAGVRRWGAASLDLAYVAAGRYDGFWERDLKVWDLAAGMLIAKEAGAMVEPIDEGREILGNGQIICANDGLFKSFAKTVRG